MTNISELELLVKERPSREHFSLSSNEGAFQMSPVGLRAFVKQPQLQFEIILRQFWGLKVRGFDGYENFFTSSVTCLPMKKVKHEYSFNQLGGPK